MSINDGIPFNIVPEPPYEKYSRGYVRIDPKMQRWIIYLHGNGEKLCGTSYARYLYNVHLYKTEGRVLTKDEVVDHINNNRLDDRLENYQILSNAENQRKENGRLGKKYVLEICPVCHKFFIIPYNNSQLTPHGKGELSFCSKGCSYQINYNKLLKEQKNELSECQVVAILRQLDYTYIYLEEIKNPYIFNRINWAYVRRKNIDPDIDEDKLFNKFIHDTNILEQKIGRKLLRNEFIHYKDGNEQNTHPDNLFIISKNDKDKLKYGYKPSIIYNDDYTITVITQTPPSILNNHR